MNFIHRYKIYKLFKIVPEHQVHGLSYLVTRFMFPPGNMAWKRLRKSMPVFIGHPVSKAFLEKLLDILFKYMGVLLFDLMLKAPDIDPSDIDKHVTFENLHVLDAALAGKKGAILVSLHTGQFFHALGGLALHPAGYKVAGVANMANRLIFDNLRVLPKFKRVYAVARDKYGTIKDGLLRHLRLNHLVFLMHDMGGHNHLKVPLVPGARDMLVPVPQGVVALQEESGAPVLPVIVIPRGRVTRSIVRFLDPAGINKALEDTRGKSPQVRHGLVSCAINAALFPYALDYLHYWEELMALGTRVASERLVLDKGLYIDEVIKHCKAWFERHVSGSFVPGRADERLVQWGSGLFSTSTSLGSQEQPNGYVLPHKTFISIGGLSSKDQIKKMFNALSILLVRAGHQAESAMLEENLSNIDNFFA